MKNENLADLTCSQSFGSREAEQLHWIAAPGRTPVPILVPGRRSLGRGDAGGSSTPPDYCKRPRIG